MLLRCAPGDRKTMYGCMYDIIPNDGDRTGADFGLFRLACKMFDRIGAAAAANLSVRERAHLYSDVQIDYRPKTLRRLGALAKNDALCNTVHRLIIRIGVLDLTCLKQEEFELHFRDDSYLLQKYFGASTYCFNDVEKFEHNNYRLSDSDLKRAWAKYLHNEVQRRIAFAPWWRKDCALMKQIISRFHELKVSVVLPRLL